MGRLKQAAACWKSSDACASLCNHKYFKRKFQGEVTVRLCFTSVNDFFCKYVLLGLKNV